MPGSLLDEINARREAEGEDPLRRRRSLLQNTGSFLRGVGRSAVDAPLSLVESAGRVGEDIDRRLTHLLGGETPGEAEQRLPTFARERGGRVRDAEGLLDITGGAAKLRRLNRAAWGGADDDSGAALAGDVVGSIAGMGGLYRRAGTAAQGLLRNSGRLAPLANTTTFWGSRAREALAGAPLTALMELPERETSSAYALGTLLDDTKYGDPIGEALLGVSESPLGRVATGVGLDVVGDVAVSGALDLRRAAGRARQNRRQPRLANPVEDAVETEGWAGEVRGSPAEARALGADPMAFARDWQRSGEPVTVERLMRETGATEAEARGVVEWIYPPERGYLNPDDPFFRPAAELEAERELDRRLFAPSRRHALARAGDPLEDLRAAEEAYASGRAALTDDPIAAALDDGTPGWLEQIDRASNVVEVGPGTTTFPRRPLNLNRLLPPEGEPRRRLVSPASETVDVAEAALPFNVRPRRPQDAPARNAPLPEDFAELDEIERALLEGDEWRGMLEQIDASSRMGPVEEVRAVPEGRAEPYAPELRPRGARRLFAPLRHEEAVLADAARPDSPVDASAPEGTAAGKVEEAADVQGGDQTPTPPIGQQGEAILGGEQEALSNAVDPASAGGYAPVEVKPDESPVDAPVQPAGEGAAMEEAARALLGGEDPGITFAVVDFNGKRVAQGSLEDMRDFAREYDETREVVPVDKNGNLVEAQPDEGWRQPAQPAREGAVGEEAVPALAVADNVADDGSVLQAEVEQVAQQVEAAVNPPVRRPQEYAVGEVLDMPEGKQYVRTAKGFRVVGSTGTPKGRTIPVGSMEVMFREVGDPIYKEHRQRARGIKSDTLLVERALSLARRAATAADEGAEFTPLMRREAQAFADEVVERGLNAGEGARLLDEVRAIDQSAEPPDARVRTAAGISLAAALTSPDALSATAGAAVGAATADEEDGGVPGGLLLGAAVGAGLGARMLFKRGIPQRVVNGISFPMLRDAGESTRAFLRRNFTSTGDLPKPVFDAKIRGHGWIESQVREVSYTVRDFERAAKDAYGGVDRMTDAEIDAVDKALKGQIDIDTLPEVIRPVVQRMRTHVDALSRRLIDDGVVQGPLAATIESGLGFYAKRSYRIFDDPDWAKAVPEDVKNRAIAYLRSEYPTSSEEEIQGVLAELLFRGEQSPIALIQKRRLGAKAMDTLKKRDDIHPTIRALWGEYGEAQINYAKSVGSMAQIIGNHQILIAAREAGMGKWLFEQPIVRDGQQYAVQIAADGSKGMAPLNGLYTTPEIRDAFEQAFESTTSGALLRAYMKANGAVKIAKTVASPQSQIRNLVGNTGFAVANGHVRGSKMIEALRTVLTDLSGRDYAQFREKYKRLLELGVVGSGTTEGELRDLVRETSKQGIGYLTSPAVTAGQKLLKGATAAYRASDDLWKVFAFENEVARYQDAFPDRPRQEIEALAAEVVRNTYPNYEMVPNAVKMLRRLPLVGTFVSFPAEVVRVGYNTLGQAARELKDPATRRIGLQRAAGIMAAATLTSTIGVATRQIVGVTPEEEEDMRRFLPSWSKHAQFFHLGKDDRGNRRFVNVGYTDPYSYLKEPVIALLSGEDWEKKLTEVAWMLAEPFFGEELLAGRLIDISRNKKKESGGSIYNEQAPLPDRVADQLAYVAEAFEPGILTSAKRMYKGATGETSSSGRVYNLRDEVVSFTTGQRREAVDVRQSLRFKARDYQQSLTDANRIINAAITNRGRVTEDEIREEYGDTEQARRRLFDAMHQDVEAAVRLGMEPAEVYAMLRQSGVSKDMGRMLLLGQYQPYRPSKQFLGSVAGSVALGAASPEERQRGLADLRARIGVLRQAYQQEVLEARKPKED